MSRRPVVLALEELDLGRWVLPGDRIIWTQGSAEPLPLVERLVQQRSRLGGVRVFLTLSFASPLVPANSDHLSFEGLGGLGDYSRLAKAGVLDTYPVHLSHFSASVSSGELPIDVAFVQLAGPDAAGNFSAGADHSYTHDVIERARVVVAEVNSFAPITEGIRAIRPDELDVIVYTSRPMAHMTFADPDVTDDHIAELAAGFVADGSTLEVGIGALPSAILRRLADRTDLGIHTGLITDAILDLMESGAVTNKNKATDRGRSTGSNLFGSQRLYEGAAHYPITFRPSRQILDPSVLSAIPRFVAFNSAVEIDLTGQVNAEYAGRYVGAVGGHVDFVRGARASAGGMSVTLLRSRTTKGVPKVVPRLSGGIVTLARSDVDVVVTEWGSAELANLSVSERAESLIAIAHPDDRADLAAAWRDCTIPAVSTIV